jgi:hypothetical protein
MAHPGFLLRVLPREISNANETRYEYNPIRNVVEVLSVYAVPCRVCSTGTCIRNAFGILP